MFPILADRELYQYTGGEPPSSIEELERLYASREAGGSPDGSELWLNWLLHERQLNEAVGYVQATVLSKYVRVAWVIGRRWQGNGYATEAARMLVQWLAGQGYSDIRANIHPLHQASQKLASHAGMRRTTEVLDEEEVWAGRL